MPKKANKYAGAAYYAEMKYFPQKLKELRTSRKETQTEIAKVLGVTRQMISNYERGLSAPDAYGLIKIAGHFNVTIDYLFVRGNYPYFEPFYKADQFKEICIARSGERFYNLCLKIMDLTDEGRDKADGYISDLLKIKSYNAAWIESEANSYKDRIGD